MQLTSAQVNDTWMKLIGRYDFYNGSVNTKAALLVAFNTFVAGGIVLKWKDILDQVEDKLFGIMRWGCVRALNCPVNRRMLLNSRKARDLLD